LNNAENIVRVMKQHRDADKIINMMIKIKKIKKIYTAISTIMNSA